MRYNLLLICSTVLLFSASCNVYRSDFDCPPGCGVPCASVTEIESMIVETQEGPDIFPMGCSPPAPSWAEQVVASSKGQPCKVWIADSEDECGYRVSGHYIYLHPNGDR